jgi:hypothetical protein
MRKLFALAVLLASTFAAMVAPSAQAVATCGGSYCTGRPPSSGCACPSYTDFPGTIATCGSWIQDCFDPCPQCR